MFTSYKDTTSCSRSKSFLNIPTATRYLSRVATMLAPALLSYSAVNAQTVEIVSGGTSELSNLQPIPLRSTGRIEIRTSPVLEANAEPKSNQDAVLAYYHQWPGVYFEAAFRGASLFLAFDDPYNEYRLSVDNGAPIAIRQPGKNRFKITGLPNTPHNVRLEKVTESIGQRGAFSGFYSLQNSTAILPLPRRRQIEFIGDSGMTGYGIRSSTRQCTQEEVRLQSDTQIAYPALAAKYFDADYQINAISGRGLVRNYDGIVPEETMSQVYPYVFLDKTTRVLKTKWQPQIIIIGLGDNDFSTPLKPDEKWKNQSALIADYFIQYDAFLVNLHRQNPKAALILMWPDDENWREPQSKAAFVKGAARIMENAKKRGIKIAEFNLYQDIALDSAACDYHSSVQDHQKLAARVIALLSSKPYQWVVP